MPSTYTPINRLEQQAAGENNNTWGERLNDNVIGLIDEALDGVVSFTLSGSKTLTSNEAATDEARQRTLNVTGGTGGTITIPNVAKAYLVRNASSGDVIITTGSGTTATIKTGLIKWVFSTGSNVVYQASGPDFGAANVVTTGTLAAGNTTITGRVDASTGLRATGFSAPASGAGIESYYDSATGNIAAVDRGAASWKPIVIRFGTAIGFHGVNGATAKITFNDTGNQRIRIHGGLPTTASAANVHHDGSGGLNEALFLSTSAEKYKRDIEPVDPAYAYAFIRNAEPIWYRSNTDLCTADNPEHGFWGFSADQVAPFEPRLVQWGYEPEDWNHTLKRVRDKSEPEGFRVVEKRKLKPGAKRKPTGFFYDRVSVHHHVIIRDLLAAKEAQAEQIAALQAAVAALQAA